MPRSTTTARIMIASQGTLFDVADVFVPGLVAPGLVEPGLPVLEPGAASVFELGLEAPLEGTGLGTTPLASGMRTVETPPGEAAVAVASGAARDDP
jgi:hypothetical protein